MEALFLFLLLLLVVGVCIVINTVIPWWMIAIIVALCVIGGLLDAKEKM